MAGLTYYRRLDEPTSILVLCDTCFCKRGDFDLQSVRYRVSTRHPEGGKIPVHPTYKCDDCGTQVEGK